MEVAHDNSQLVRDRNGKSSVCIIWQKQYLTSKVLQMLIFWMSD